MSTNSDLRWRSAGLLLAGATLAWAACGGSNGGPSDPGPDPEPQTGLIQVSTTTTGDELDPDGFTATLDGSSDRSIGLNGVTTFSQVATGSHDVTLSGLTGNCTVAGDNPVAVTVSGGATAQSAFDVVCVATAGSLEISTSTTNNFDPDGYRLLVDGVSAGAIEVNGSAQAAGVGAGNRSVELTHLAPNCQTANDNPRSVMVEVGQTTNIDFSVECLSPPDGRIAFESYRNGRTNVFVMNTDGSGLLRLTSDPASVYNKMPSWSPDGRYIAFTSDEADVGPRISVMKMDGSELTHITAPGTSADDVSPVWSPDGTQIAFTRRISGPWPQTHYIYVVNSDGSDLEQLTTDPAWDGYPSWSPDGSRIVFASDRDLGEFEGCDLYVIELASGDLTRLTDTQEDGMCEQEPAWSPDGTQIAFGAIPRSVDASIEVMSPDGSGRRHVSDGRNPRWSPDGSEIVFKCSDTAGDEDICVVSADGTGRANITNTPSTLERFPDWGP